MRIFLAYYSGSGNTAAVAGQLQDAWRQAGHHVDAFRITAQRPRSAPGTGGR